MNKLLRAFTSKHRPTLCQCAYLALILDRFPENADDMIFLVQVRKRPGANRTELAYIVENASPIPYSQFRHQEAEMQAVRKAAHESQRGLGYDGTFMMMLLDVENGMSNIAPGSFKVKDANPTPIPWKDYLIQQLNEGRIR